MDGHSTAVIVEDDVATQSLLAAVARRCGLTARVARDGEAAIALILTERPSVLVLDLVLPHLSGVAVLQHVSQVWPQLLPRTVIVTAADEKTLRTVGPALRKVHCVMRKPLDIEELGGEIEQCVRLTV